MNRHRLGSIAVLAAVSALSFASPAFAHVEIASGPGSAGQSQVITFVVAHGCSGADTVSIDIHIPDSVTTVRALPSLGFDSVAVNTDDSGAITDIMWKKADARPKDDLFYQMQLRIKVPDAAFSTIYFPVTQVCRSSDGTETTVDWSALPDDPPPADGGESTPAAALKILPAHGSGWNKFTMKDKLTDLSFFADAQIVWVDNAAYSSNAATMDLIKAGATVWVKY